MLGIGRNREHNEIRTVRVDSKEWEFPNPWDALRLENIEPSILIDSEVETIWISLIGWHHKTSTTYVLCLNNCRLTQTKKI